MRDHLILMLIYALAVGIFFGTMWKDTPGERVRHGAFITGGLGVGALVVSWLMALAH